LSFLEDESIKDKVQAAARSRELDRSRIQQFGQFQPSNACLHAQTTTSQQQPRGALSIFSFSSQNHGLPSATETVRDLLHVLHTNQVQSSENVLRRSALISDGVPSRDVIPVLDGFSMQAGVPLPFNFRPTFEGRRRSQLDPTAVVYIFRAKRFSKSEQNGSALSNRLAAEFGLTAKAVRDIWNMRTWRKVTQPHWNKSDHRKAMEKVLCSTCRALNLASIEVACDACKVKHRKKAELDKDGKDSSDGDDAGPPV